MEDDWSFSLSRSYQSSLKSLNDLCLDFDDAEDEDELRTEYACPFCEEDLDLVGLCCHIDDEHPYEDSSGVCPVCATRVGTEMVGHITMQHGSIFKSLYKLKLKKGSTHSSSWKEYDDEHFQSLLSRSSSTVSSSKMAPDPLLSFLSFTAPPDQSESVQSAASTEVSSDKTSTDEKILEKNVQQSPSSDKELMEKANMCEFVQGLLMSTIFDDDS